MLLLIFYLLCMSTIICFYFGVRLGKKGGFLVSNIFLTISNVIIIIVFINHCNQDYPIIKTIVLFQWIKILYLIADFTIIIDSISITMLIIIITVSLCVHYFSVYYMYSEPYTNKFMSYLSLFTLSMSILVTSTNFLNLFLGWEGVGLCSFLLISFWNSRIQANKSAMKAMLINRIGDFFLLIAGTVSFIYFKSINFYVIFSLAHVYEKILLITWYPMQFGDTVYLSVVDVICMLLICSIMTKSAQIGFHGWLPDAMEGPTPVSALIHAATMVTAGVFLFIRCSYLFEFSWVSVTILMYCGSLTIIIFGTIGFFQFDVKKIIAYSTCSQLGYMILACSLSSYNIALFHLSTHASFKALLFLIAGCIIHIMNNEQDIRKLNGFFNINPGLSVMFFIANLSLIGFPFFSGFYSKETIINVSYFYFENPVIFFSSLLGVLLTTLYTLKLLYFIFIKKNNNYNYNSYKKQNIIFNFFQYAPLIILTVLSILFGYIFKDIFIGIGSNFFYGIIYQNPNNYSIFYEYIPTLMKALPTLVIFMSCVLFYFIINENFFLYFNRIYKFFNYKIFWDSITNLRIAYPVYKHGNIVFKLFDKGLLEKFGFFNIIKFLNLNTRLVKTQLQTGYLNLYTQHFIITVSLVLVYFTIL